MTLNFFKQVFRYAPILCLLNVSCGVKGPPLPPLPSTPQEMERVEEKTQPSPLPSNSMTPSDRSVNSS